jgi:hypothetical protein
MTDEEKENLIQELIDSGRLKVFKIITSDNKVIELVYYVNKIRDNPVIVLFDFAAALEGIENPYCRIPDYNLILKVFLKYWKKKNKIKIKNKSFDDLVPDWC